MSTVYEFDYTKIEDKNQLLQIYQESQKKTEDFLIGFEVEKLGLTEDLSPLPYSSQEGPSVKQFLHFLAQEMELEGIYEEGNIIALKGPLGMISLEPGGQIEYSMRPWPTLQDISEKLEDFKTLLEKGEEIFGIHFWSMGYHPLAKVEDMPWMPKKRYEIMKHYLPQKGKRALDMMLLTASLQVSLDYESEEDMAEKFRLAQGLDPLLIALYANSPFRQGKYSGFHSFRGKVWTEVDPHRCCYIPDGFLEDFSFQKYMDYLLDVPMLFLVRDGKWQSPGGLTFREFMEHGWNGYFAVMGDWLLHTTALFTQVRLRPWIEIRSPDLPPHELTMSFPALLKGIFYDKRARQEAWRRLGTLDDSKTKALRHEATLNSLEGSFGQESFQSLALDILEIAKEGLKAQNDQESIAFLEPLFHLVRQGKSPAACLLEECANPQGELILNCHCFRKMILQWKK